MKQREGGGKEKKGDRGMIGQELKGERIKEQRWEGKQGSG